MRAQCLLRSFGRFGLPGMRACDHVDTGGAPRTGRAMRVVDEERAIRDDNQKGATTRSRVCVARTV